YPALYFGGRDDGSWYSRDGGQHWQSGINCGDCQGFYSNTQDPTTVIALNRDLGTNGGRLWLVYRGQPGAYPTVNPNGGDASTFELTPYQNWPPTSTDRGWTPVIQPLPSETDPANQLSLALVHANSATPNPNLPPSYYQQLGGWDIE